MKQKAQTRSNEPRLVMLSARLRYLTLNLHVDPIVGYLSRDLTQFTVAVIFEVFFALQQQIYRIMMALMMMMMGWEVVCARM